MEAKTRYKGGLWAGVAIGGGGDEGRLPLLGILHGDLISGASYSRLTLAAMCR